jgi:RHS repeat-associated protein
MASRRSNRTGRFLTILLLVLCVTALISCNEPEQNTYNNQGATGIKPFWTYDSNAIGGGGKAMINLWGGNLLVQYTDVSFPGRGLPVELRRTYNSQTAYEGYFGRGWTSILDTHLTIAADKITLMDAYGGTFEFTNPQQDGDDTKYTSPPGRNTIFKKLANGTYTEKKKNGSTYFFNTEGKLTRLQHRNSSNYIQITYGGDGYPISIQEASNRFTTIEYGGNGKKRRITKITDPQGRETQYSYNSDRCLKRSKDPEGAHTDYEYNGNGFLSTITNPLGKPSNITYDSTARVITFQDPMFTVTYSYGESSTTISDTNDHHLVYTLNQSGNATQITDTLNYSTSLQWDAAMNVTSITNAKNQTTTLTYDDRGNVLTSTNSLYSTSYTYDTSNNLLTTKDGMGKTTTCVYTPTTNDPDGVLQSVTTPGGRTVTFSYNDYDEPIAVTNARGFTTSYVHDANGNVTSVTDANGKTSSITYNNVGEALSSKDPLGRTTSFTYFDDGLVNTVTTPGSNGNAATTTYTYFKDGSKKKITDPLGRSTHYTYNDDGQMLTVKDETGKTTTYTYLKGRLASTADPSGFTTTMSYDANDRLISSSSPITSESMSYDPLGAVTQKTTSLGVINYQYDELNRLTNVSRPNKTAGFAYDNSNNRVSASVVDTGGSSALSNLEVVYYYDDDNRLTDKVTTLDGTQMESSTCQYDENNNLTHMAKTIQRGLPPTPAGLLGQSFDFSYSYSYDSLDRQTGVTNSNGDTFTAEYDDAGNMLSVSYPDSTSSVRTFDAENRIANVSNDHPNPLNDPPYVSYTYRYDNNGNCTSFKKDPNNSLGFLKYEYDKLNRLTYDESEQMRFVYDDAGNKIRDRLLSSNRNIVYTYNNAHQVVKRTPGTGLQMPTYNFEYDVNGNQSRKYSPDTPSIPNIVNAFDAINRLRSVKSYQNPGSRGAAVAKAQGPDEMLYSEESFSYDGDDELFFSEKKTYTSPPATSDYNFNNVYHGYEFGALLYKNFTSGTYTDGALDETTLVHSVEYYTYLNGLKVGVSALAGDNTRSRVSVIIPSFCKSTFFLYDGMGNVVQTSNRAGDIPYCMYKYSAYGACERYEGQEGYRSSYKGYDQGPFGCKTGVRHYDPDTGRFLSPDAFKGHLAEPASQNPYMYCKGNPIKYSDPDGYNAGLIAEIGIGAYLTASYITMVGGSPDTQFDMQSMAMDLAQGDYLSASLDLVSMAIPGVTGLGQYSKPIRAFFKNKLVGHHTIPRQVLKKLNPSVRKAVQGKKGSPNIWDIPEYLHKEAHGKMKYNPKFQTEVDKLKRQAKPDDIFNIRDDMVKQSDIHNYRP